MCCHYNQTIILKTPDLILNSTDASNNSSQNEELNFTTAAANALNDSVCIILTVLRRGDICRNSVIDNNDVIYVARYLADLEPECLNPPSLLVTDVVGLYQETPEEIVL